MEVYLHVCGYVWEGIIAIIVLKAIIFILRNIWGAWGVIIPLKTHVPANKCMHLPLLRVNVPCLQLPSFLSSLCCPELSCYSPSSACLSSSSLTNPFSSSSSHDSQHHFLSMYKAAPSSRFPASSSTLPSWCISFPTAIQRHITPSPCHVELLPRPSS